MKGDTDPAHGPPPAASAGRTRTTRIISAVSIVAATCVLAGVVALRALSDQGPAAGEEIAVDRNARGSFDLLDHAGRRVTESDFSGKFMLVFFGYASCPDVCPTDLQVIGTAVDALGKAGGRVQPIFVTLDPGRDKANLVASYVRHFHPRFLGLGGTPEQVALAAQTYGVIYMKAAAQPREGKSAENAFYLIDHSAYIYLLGPDGRFLAVFSHGIDPKRLAAGIAKHMKEHPRVIGARRLRDPVGHGDA